MIADIERFLRSNPGAMAKEIARHLGTQKSVVNPLLYRHSAIFLPDGKSCWFLVNPERMTITLKNAWVDSASFEEALAVAGSPLDFDCSVVEFVVPKGCKIMIDAAARILALCNQLVLLKKSVSIDFSACKTTMTYFNRLGFFDHLDGQVNVLPDRPKWSAAQVHHGNNDGVVELAAIDHRLPDETIPKRLKNSLVSCAGERYSQSAFTVISELFGNVRDHAQSLIPGFAALQHYPKGGKIQTVISDSGIGIVGSLQPVLEQKYPGIFRQLDFSKPEAGPELVLRVFEQGQISSSSDDGRGLGLKRSGEVAADYNATISIRQQSFELTMVHSQGKLTSDYRVGIPTLHGTHICFEFLIDS